MFFRYLTKTKLIKPNGFQKNMSQTKSSADSPPSYREAVTEKDNGSNILKAELEAKDKKIEDLESDVKSLNTVILCQQEEITSYQNEVNLNQKELEDKDKKIKKLESRFKKMRDKFEDMAENGFPPEIEAAIVEEIQPAWNQMLEQIEEQARLDAERELAERSRCVCIIM